MRYGWKVVAGSLIAASASSLASAQGSDPRGSELRKLEKRVTIDLADARFEDVVIFIEQVGDIDLEPIWADESAGAAGFDGLDKEALVTLKLRDGTLMTILERALEQTQTDFAENTWQFTSSGSIEIGPKSRLNERAFVKLYDVADLTFIVPDFPEVPELDLDTVLQQSSQRGGRGGGGGIFQDPDDISVDNILNDEAAQTMQLMDLITQSIEPEQWVSNGGDGASVTQFRQQFLVRAPDYIHRQIGGYDFAGGKRAGAPQRRVAEATRPLNATTPTVTTTNEQPSSMSSTGAATRS
jgi:hypothetical protein